MRYSIELQTLLGNARDLAHVTGHPSPRPEHLLISLLGSPGQALGKILDLSGLDVVGLIADLERFIARSSTASDTNLPQTNFASEAIKKAEAEAAAMGSQTVLPEHLLLTLLALHHRPLAKIIKDNGASLERLRQLVAQGSAEHAARTQFVPLVITTDVPTLDELRDAIRQAGINDEAIAVVADLDVLPPSAVADFMAALDALHRAWGGAGLVIESDHVGAALARHEVVR